MATPTQTKPWINYYPAELPDIKETECSLIKFIKTRNEKYKGSVALNYFDNKISFKQLSERVYQTAQAFYRLGVREGDFVTVVSVKTPEIIYLFYAMDLLGAVPNMVDPRTSPEGIKEYIKEVRSKVVVALSVTYDKVKEAVQDLPVEHVINVSPAFSLAGIKKIGYRLTQPDKNDYAPNVIQWPDFYAAGAEKVVELSDDNYNPDRASIMLHTGGTTGTAKCVLLNAKAINAVALQTSYVLQTNAGDTMLDVMPPFIAYGFFIGVHTPLCCGATCIIIPNLDPKELGKLLLHYKPGHMAGVPLHLQELVHDPRLKNADLSFLKTPACGGDSINEGAEKEVDDFLKAHGCKNGIIKGYGMTEAAAAVCFTTPDHGKLGSVGFPLCFTDISIFDSETGREMQLGEEGEVCVAGPNLMLEYYENPGETANIMRTHADGKKWVHTGDIGVIDEDGFLFIRSRIKRVIIRHDGFKIYSVLIENAVSTHKDVQMCSAVGVKDPSKRQGLLPVAFAVKEPESRVDNNQLKKELKALCEKELPEYVLPLGYMIIDEMPLTPIGKVDYRALEEMAKKVDWTKEKI